MAEGTIIYLSFVEAIKEGLPKKYHFAALEALIVYGATGQEPDLSQFPPAMAPLWLLIKPQIDANNRRRTNGAKGGRPKKGEAEKLKKPMVIESKTILKPKVKDKDLSFTSVKDNSGGDRPGWEAGLPPSADDIAATIGRLRARGATRS